MVSKQVLIKSGGVPDYGTPFLGDYAYLAIMSSNSGCVVINRPLGCQTMHKGNFGRNQNEQIAIAAKKFPMFLEERMSYLKEWGEIKKLVLKFIGMWVVSHTSFLYFYLGKSKLKETEKEIFKIEHLKPYKILFKNQGSFYT